MQTGLQTVEQAFTQSGVGNDRLMDEYTDRQQDEHTV